jgi:hypothetical protein
MTANSIHLVPADFQRELSMEAYLVENEKVLGLDNELFEGPEVLCEELPLIGGRAKKITDGRIDLLVSYSDAEILGLIELKKGEISKENIEQLSDYLKKRNDILQSDLLRERFEQIKDYKWLGILAGTSISLEFALEIQKGLDIEVDGVKIPIAALVVKRYRSDDGQIFVVTDSYLNSMRTTKDLTKYIFNNKEYGKGRLVLAVVQEYVKQNPKITFIELKDKFKDNLQGYTGVFQTKEEAVEMNSKDKRVRYFTKENEIIELVDQQIAVSSQWGKGNIDKFISEAKKHGLPINTK